MQDMVGTSGLLEGEFDRRFYDQEPMVKGAITALAEFQQAASTSPELEQIASEQNSAIGTILAKGMSLFAIRDFNAHEKIDPQKVSQRKSLGTKVVLSLYKSKQKKRAYDASPDLHNAINHLRVLTSEERIIVSTKVLDLTRYVQQYLMVCESSRNEPLAEKVQTIRDTYIIKGEALARQYVEAVCLDLLKTMPPPDSPPPAIRFEESEFTQKLD
ncbi:MAG: hypothetical protein VKJ04_07825 [Vampirovibrionales bacterium]|nr:hypothetical protein [Vampirovibrionales bacterium]